MKGFRDLHEAGCFVMPNPWDRGSALMLASLGFRALATSSAGFAFTRGLPDQVSALPMAAVLAHAREIAAATALPVSADFQHGYADSPAGVADNVKACVDTGVAGLSIEDATGDPEAPLYTRSEAIDRVRAASDAIRETRRPVLLTARCEAALRGLPDARQTVLDRLVAYADAGADCLFAPGIRDAETIATMVRAVAPRPLNVLMSTAGLSVAELADLGVRRISVGSALARVAWAAALRAARELAGGSFDALREATPVHELNALFRR